MKKRMKKLAGIVLSAVLLLGNVVSVSADSIVAEKLDGTDVSGRVSYNATSATAVTSFPRSGANIYVSVIAYAPDGNLIHTDIATATNTAGGASATAIKTGVPADVFGGKGGHQVTWGSHSWSATTTAGTTY